MSGEPDDELGLGVLDDMARLFLRSMSAEDLHSLLTDASADLMRASELLLRSDRYGLAVLRRIANRLPRLVAELEERVDQR